MIAPAKDIAFRSGEPAIVLDQVTKSFGENLVLNGVTGTIASGKVLGLLGRNGEGKTYWINSKSAIWFPGHS